jgi:hypothetical protein
MTRRAAIITTTMVGFLLMFGILVGAALSSGYMKVDVWGTKNTDHTLNSATSPAQPIPSSTQPEASVAEVEAVDNKAIAEQEKQRDVAFLTQLHSNTLSVTDHLHALGLLFDMYSYPTDPIWLQSVDSELQGLQRDIDQARELRPTERLKSTYAIYMEGMDKFEVMTTGLVPAFERNDALAVQRCEDAELSGEQLLLQSSNEMMAATGT